MTLACCCDCDSLVLRMLYLNYFHGIIQALSMSGGDAHSLPMEDRLYVYVQIRVTMLVSDRQYANGLLLTSIYLYDPLVIQNVR